MPTRLSDLIDPAAKARLIAAVGAAETKSDPDAAAGGPLEHKAEPLATQVLDTNDDTGVVRAIVSVTGVEDRVKDIIEPGSYTKTLTEREPIGVWSHDDKTWVARAEATRELMPGDPIFAGLKTQDGQPWPAAAGGLLVDARFNLDTPHGAAAYSDVKFFQGKTSWSIGYRATKAHRNPRTGVRHIKELQLFEFSPVMVGAASQAMTLSVKSLAASHAVDPDDPTGIAPDEALATLTAEELDRKDALMADFEEKVRRVRSAAGVARFGVPINSIIPPGGRPDAPSAGKPSGDASLTRTKTPSDATRKGQRVQFTKPGPGGMSDPVTVDGVLAKDPEKRGSSTVLTVNGEEHRLFGSAPVTVLSSGSGSPVAAPASTTARSAGPARAEAPSAGTAKVGDRGRLATMAPGSKVIVRDPDAGLFGMEVTVVGQSGDGVAVVGPRGNVTISDNTAVQVSRLPGEGRDPAAAPARTAAADRPDSAGRDAVPGTTRPNNRPLSETLGTPAMQGFAASQGADQSQTRMLRDNERHDFESGRYTAGGTSFDVSPARLGANRNVTDPSTNEEIGQVAHPDPDSLTRNISWTTGSGLGKAVVRGTMKDALTELAKQKRAAAPARKAPPVDDPKYAKLAGFDSLKDANSDSEDFADVAVWGIEAVVDTAWADAGGTGKAPTAVRKEVEDDLGFSLTTANSDSEDFHDVSKGAIRRAAKIAQAAAAKGRKDADLDLEAKGSRASLDASPRSNWVEKAGGLPGYFREVARGIARDSAVPLSQAIPMAIGRVKKWARGGDGVKADTVAKAVAAVAEWEALKLKNRAKGGDGYDTTVLDDLDTKGLVYDPSDLDELVLLLEFDEKAMPGFIKDKIAKRKGSDDDDEDADMKRTPHKFQGAGGLCKKCMAPKGAKVHTNTEDDEKSGGGFVDVSDLLAAGVELRASVDFEEKAWSLTGDQRRGVAGRFSGSGSPASNGALAGGNVSAAAVVGRRLGALAGVLRPRTELTGGFGRDQTSADVVGRRLGVLAGALRPSAELTRVDDVGARPRVSNVKLRAMPDEQLQLLAGALPESHPDSVKVRREVDRRSESTRPTLQQAADAIGPATGQAAAAMKEQDDSIAAKGKAANRALDRGDVAAARTLLAEVEVHKRKRRELAALTSFASRREGRRKSWPVEDVEGLVARGLDVKSATMSEVLRRGEAMHAWAGDDLQVLSDADVDALRRDAR